MAFTNYKKLNLTNGQAGTADSTDWPLLIGPGYAQAADNDLKTIANGGKVQSSSGYDIRPYTNLISAGGTEMKFELVTYDGTNGKLEMWTKVATLNGSVTGTDTVIYLYFGDPTLTSNGSDADNTWKSTFLVVHHLQATAFADSSGNARSTTNNGSVTATTGEINNGATFSGTDQSLLLSAAACPVALSYTGWINGTAWTNAYNGFIGHFYGGSSYQTLLIKSTGKLACYVYASANVSYDGTGSNTLSTGTWYHLAMTYSSSAGLVGYVNGASDGTAAANGNLNGDYNLPTDPSKEWAIGNDTNNLTARDLNGLLDEMRLADTALSASWIKADYNSQLKTSSTFIVWGALVSLSNGMLPLAGAGN